MYSKYGKCNTKKSSKESEKSAETGKSEDEKPVTGEHAEDDKAVGSEHGEDDKTVGGEHGEDEDEETEGGGYRKKSSQTSRDPDEAGFPSTDDDNDPTKGSSEKYHHSSEEELEGGESGPGIEDETAVGGESEGFDQDEAFEDSEISGESEEWSADGKKRRKIKAVMEYDLKDMYPEMNVLIQKKKREWDFQDPDIIRALWLETKTLALSEWKVRNAKIKIDKPSFEIKDTRTVNLRLEHLKNKAELEQALQERDFEMTEASRNPPHFDSIQLATNLTTDMRYKYNRNNPPVPSHYIEHFEKYKKPPFKNHSIWYVYS